MIIYQKEYFGLNLLFRVHGSAVYRAVIPALTAVVSHQSLFCFLFRFVFVSLNRHSNSQPIYVVYSFHFP